MQGEDADSAENTKSELLKEQVLTPGGVSLVSPHEADMIHAVDCAPEDVERRMGVGIDETRNHQAPGPQHYGLARHRGSVRFGDFCDDLVADNNVAVGEAVSLVNTHQIRAIAYDSHRMRVRPIATE